MTPEEKDLALAWYVKGFDLSTIAQHFGLTRDQLASQLNNVKRG